MAPLRTPLRSFANVPRRFYSGAPTPSAKLNLPIDYKTTPILHHTSSSLANTTDFPAGATSKRLNFFQAINSALKTALSKSEKVLLFGEDVAFGGVFRCSMDLQTEFGSDRVFNTPLTEQGIAGFAIGCAVEGMKPVLQTFLDQENILILVVRWQRFNLQTTSFRPSIKLSTRQPSSVIARAGQGSMLAGL